MNKGRIEQTGTPEQVYNQPSTPFVYGFLGNVNLFHGRIDDGTTHIDGSTNGHLIFVRPHSLEISRVRETANSFRAQTRAINAAGSIVKVEAVAEWGATIHIEMTQARYRELGLQKDEQVFIIPRDAGVFAHEQL